MRSSYPRRFGKYVLLAPLAQGGMGELHLAYSGRADLRKLCVIKTILTHLADEEFTTRFVDEAKVMVKLSHGNLIPVLEAGKADGQMFLAMEYIDGKDLRDVWLGCNGRGQTMPLDVAVYVAREICRGLSYVHQYGDLHLVHRDVSPPNVLLSYTGEVRLTDFGVATSTIKLQKTAPGILLGKLSYMSPEQARNESVDARADICPVGVILWEIITGQRLLSPEGDLAERYEVAIDPTFRPPSSLNREVPPELDRIASRALAPSRDKRYADAEQMRLELSQLLGKISPAIDASAVQALLKELFAGEREEEEREQRKLLDSMAGDVRRLMDGAGSGLLLPAPEADTGPLAQPSAASEFQDDATEDLGYSDDLDLGEAPCLEKGVRLGKRYQIEDLVGEGGMGRVYLATHVDIGKQVAVKVLHPTYSRMPDLVSRFRREARAATRIGTPHIVEVYDSGKTDDGSIYFVMEYLDGIDLADVLANEGRLGIQRSLNISIQICEAVAAAHEAGIIHRDLKPENIYLCTREGTPDFVKVLDFGLAQSTGLEESRKERLTNPGMAMGTPEYMAPEQAAGKPTDHRADVYAVGTLLYEMLIGTPPHMGDNIMEVFNRKAVEPVVPPRKLREEVPPELEHVVMWALEYDADKRVQTMAQMGYELNKLSRGRAGAVASLLGIASGVADGSGPVMAVVDTGGEPYEAEPFTARVKGEQPPPPGMRWLVVVMVLVAAGLGATALYLFRAGGRQPSPPRPVVGTGPSQSPDSGAPPAADLSRVAVVRTEDAAPARRDEGTPAAGRPSPKRPQQRQYLAEGRQHLMAGRFDEARAAFREAAKQRRERGRANLGLAEVEFQLGRFKAAEEFAKESLEHGGGWRARLVLANIYYRLRDYHRAVRLYEAVLAARPDHA
ncbi:MAG: serine/threonine protein kinase, partial [Deltaproteobacteria bacterium]|nr:serine/threonine protein kinase [Deltaproteobacteria bacterium]